MGKYRIGLFYSLVRGDEKLLIDAAKKLDVQLELINIDNLILKKDVFKPKFDIALLRSVSSTKEKYVAFFLESLGIKTVNSFKIIQNCDDKFFTSILLEKKGVAQPKFGLAFSLNEAKKLIEKLGGYPVVIKPTTGSWGRMLAKVNDEDALEAIFEHKQYLNSPSQKALYIQKFIEKGGRDIRAFVFDGEVICAIYRNSHHWITNTARGGIATNCQVNQELKKICFKASEAIGHGILAMDIFESQEGYLVNEVNHTMEFKNSEKPTGVSISSKIISYCLKKIKND